MYEAIRSVLNAPDDDKDNLTRRWRDAKLVELRFIGIEVVAGHVGYGYSPFILQGALLAAAQLDDNGECSHSRLWSVV